MIRKEYYQKTRTFVSSTIYWIEKKMKWKLLFIQMLSNFVLACSEMKNQSDVFAVIRTENRACLLWTEWHCLLTSVILLLVEKRANIKGKWNCVLVQRSGLVICVNMMQCLFKGFLNEAKSWSCWSQWHNSLLTLVNPKKLAQHM